MVKMIKKRDSIVILRDANIHVYLKNHFYCISKLISLIQHVKSVERHFLLKAILIKHLLIHENKRQFKCPHKRCGKSFNTNNIWRFHQLVHLKKQIEM